jgi:hypothetical protein
MGHKDTIIAYLSQNKGYYCDDCLSKLCNINPRQTVFQIATKLKVNEEISRSAGICSFCFKEKTVSSMIGDTCNNNLMTDFKKKIQVNDKTEKFIKVNEEFNKYYKEFIEVKLEFEKFNIENTFSRFNAHTLGEILIKDKYIKLRAECKGAYEEYMEVELGSFLSMLKENKVPFYKKFLNHYGDQLFCKFKMEETFYSKFKGLYMYKHDNKIKYIGRVKGNLNFQQRINAGYANISPKNCYIDGQATNCHINAIINEVGGQVKLYIMPLEDDEEICLLERKLIQENEPEWNIALK